MDGWYGLYSIYIWVMSTYLKTIHYKPSHHEPFDQALTRPDPDLIMISAIVNLDGIDGVPILAGLYLSSIIAHHTKRSRAENW